MLKANLTTSPARVLFKHSGSNGSKAFWDNPGNRRKYLENFARENNIVHYSNWYNVANIDIQRHGGASLLTKYDNRLYILLEDIFGKEYSFYPWLFKYNGVPPNFWAYRINQLRFLAWFSDLQSKKKLLSYL